MSLEGRAASIGVPHLEDPFVFGDPRFSEQQQQCRCGSAASEAAENVKCHPRVEHERSSSARSPASRGTSPCDPTILRIDEASSTETPEKCSTDVTETIDECSRNDEMSTANSTLSLETSSSSSDPDQRIIHGRLAVDNEETSRQRGPTAGGGVARRHHHNNHPHHHHHHHHHHQLQQSSQIDDFSDPNRFDNEARSLREKNRANCASNDSKINHNDIDELRRIDDASPNNVVNYSPGFRNFHHQEHMIMQQQPSPLQRGIGNNPANAKGTFDTLQVTTGMIALEKGKCQCHQIQPHPQQQQSLSHLQQRDQTHTAALPPHHHHHHQQQQQQQLQEQEHHRHKFSHQRNQPHQQQNYRHHHYHHPHQHIGQQQQQQPQDEQRGQSEQTAAAGRKLNNSGTDESDDMMLDAESHHQPPALPPRPPPRPNRRYEHNPNAPYDLGPNNGDDTGCCKKYVVLCCLCGGLSAAVGSLFLAVHAVLSAHTASLALFETVPSYIPGTMLILMGLFTILLARRKHRYGFLMKMCGSVGVVCALVCVLVTVTTTVVHMSRLQGLRECIYTEIARSCTCYGSTQGRVLSDPGVLFEETPHCEVVHGALYDCLRALFGVSVAGILACIFSCMLLYQLLSHEKKKMYWEQLQLRCRSLYGQGSGAVGGATGGSCGCCNDCGGTSPWWAQTPGNLYTPNPDLAPFRRWRLPWSRSRGPAPTPDSNYGFHTTQSRGAVVMRSSGSSSGEPGENTAGPYSVLTDESHTGGGAPYSLINSTSSGVPYAACASSVASYSLLENGPPVPAALWGPPPPYSDPNSPARRPIQLSNNEERRAAVTMRSPGNTGTPVNLSNRIVSGANRMDNFEAGNCEEYRQRVARPSDNYENTEEVLSSSTDPDIEMGSLHHHNHHHHHHHHLSQQRQQQQDDDGSSKATRRARKLLKGVENGAFQQEAGNNSLTKQSESELYFGDVSSCCGPESSFYDLAVDKEQQSGTIETSDAPIEYPPSSRFAKQRLSPKRSPRQPAPLPVNLSPEGSLVALRDDYPVALGNGACSGPTTVVVDDLSRSSSTRGPYLAPDAQYEVIAQQTRYTYYNAKSSGVTGEQDADRVDSATSCHDYPNERSDVCVVVANGKPKSGGTPLAKSPSPSIVATPPSSPHPGVSSLSQRCNNETGSFAHFRDRQVGHQTRTSEGVCPVNV